MLIRIKFQLWRRDSDTDVLSVSILSWLFTKGLYLKREFHYNFMVKILPLSLLRTMPTIVIAQAIRSARLQILGFPIANAY